MGSCQHKGLSSASTQLPPAVTLFLDGILSRQETALHITLHHSLFSPGFLACVKPTAISVACLLQSPFHGCTQTEQPGWGVAVHAGCTCSLVTPDLSWGGCMYARLLVGADRPTVGFPGTPQVGTQPTVCLLALLGGSGQGVAVEPHRAVFPR